MAVVLTSQLRVDALFRPKRIIDTTLFSLVLPCAPGAVHTTPEAAPLCRRSTQRAWSPDVFESYPSLPAYRDRPNRYS